MENDNNYTKDKIRRRNSKSSITRLQNIKNGQITGKLQSKKVLYVAFLICGWYLTSISLSLYNATLFSIKRSDFHFPLFTAGFHMAMQYGLATAGIALIRPDMKPKSFPPLSQYLLKVVPCGVATALDIGLSNSSLKTISVSFYTMVKSAAPVFVLFFAYVFGLERITVPLVISIFVICLGVGIMVANEPAMDWVGYVQIQLATIISGLRWTLTQLLLKSSDLGISNPLATTSRLAPIISISLFFGSFAVEGFGELANAPQFKDSSSAFFLILGISGAGILAFAMILFEFQLISSTSVVTLSVAGICKEILTILSSVVIMKDTLTVNMIIGLIVSLIGIGGYNFIRINSKHSSNDDYHELDVDEFELDLIEEDNLEAESNV